MFRLQSWQIAATLQHRLRGEEQLGQRRGQGGGERLAALLPVAHGEAARAPQLRQHDQVVTCAGRAHQPGHPVGARLDALPDLLADQQLGGTIAWGIGELPTVVLMLLVALDWMRRDDREARRSDRQAERDHDAELVAYNARLRAMGERGRAVQP